MRIAYFTAGTVGAGHFVRGVAIARGLGRTGFAGSYRMFGPRLPFPLAQRSEHYQEVPIQEERGLLQHPHLAQTGALAARLREFRPDLLLVDLFWAPLRWILPALGCEAWLLVRTCPPVWLVGSRETPFAPEHYTRVIGIEPVAYPALGEVIEPIVVCNRDECRPPGALRDRLGRSEERELAVVVHAGETGEAEALAAAAAGRDAVPLDLFAPEPLFPAAEWLGGADRIFCGAGYNSYWEARWLGYDGCTTFVPFARTIDDQAARLRQFAAYQPRRNGADILAGTILAG